MQFKTQQTMKSQAEWISTKCNVSTRNLMSELRTSGLVGGGPPPLNEKDLQKFSSAFDRIVTKLLQT